MVAVKVTLASEQACKSNSSVQGRSTTNDLVNRRKLFLVAGSTLFLSTSAPSTPNAIAAAPLSPLSPPTPYQRGQNLEYGLNPDGRIRSCDAAAQPNCVSTSSLSELYSPPWTVHRESTSCGPECMMEELDSVLHDMHPDALLVSKLKVETEGVYRRYRIPSLFGSDMLE